MCDLVCPLCGGSVVASGSQITSLPGAPEKMHIDYRCAEVGCAGALKDVTGGRSG